MYLTGRYKEKILMTWSEMISMLILSIKTLNIYLVIDQLMSKLSNGKTSIRVLY